MKRLTLATGLFAAIVCSSLHAQTMDMRATIPFDFRVGSTALPSGEYRIRQATNGVLFVADTEGKHAANILTVGENHPPMSKPGGILQFSRYGSDYYLSKLWTSDSVAGRKLLKTKRETELARRIGLTETASVSTPAK